MNASINDDTIDVANLKNHADILDVAGRLGLHVERRGTKYTTQEHDSLILFPQDNSWHRFSSGDGGDVISLVRYFKNCGFKEACEFIDNHAVSTPYYHTPVVTPVTVPALPQDLHLRYNRNLDNAAREWWHSEGINDEGIARFFLGVCEYHPYWKQTTYTIPVIENGKLINIRHRLSSPPKPKDKYRPEAAGLPVGLFNADILTPELGGVVIVAGEKKTIVLWQYGIPAISSTSGCGTWKDEWTTRLQFCRKAYIAFDPGESVAAWKVAEHIGERAFVVNLPDKPDDFIIASGEAAFRDCLRNAEPYADREYWRRRVAPGRPLWGKLLDA